MNELAPIEGSCNWSGHSIMSILEAAGYIVLRMYDGSEMGLPLIVLKPPVGTEASIKNDKIINGSLCLYPYDHSLYADGKSVKLTAIELKIVELFMQNLGHIFPADEIYKQVWGATAFSLKSIIPVHINHVRKKIEPNPRSPQYIKTVWGVGYVMERVEKV